MERVTTLYWNDLASEGQVQGFFILSWIPSKCVLNTKWYRSDLGP